MQKVDVGRAIQIIANLGVLGGILLLVYELNQNRQIMQAQIRNDLAQAVVDIAISDTADPVRASILRRGLYDEDELSVDDQWIIDRRINAQLRYWENVHYQFRVGMYDETEFSTQLKAIQRVLGTQRRLVEHWCDFEDTYSPEFAAEIDRLLSTYRCE